MVPAEHFAVQGWPISVSVWWQGHRDSRHTEAENEDEKRKLEELHENEDEKRKLEELHGRLCPFTLELLQSTREQDLRRVAGNGMHLEALGAFAAFVLSALARV